MIRCEGYCRIGGAFSLGPVLWNQCSSEASVTLSVVQDSKTETLPSCFTCWQEAIDSSVVKVQNANPIMMNAKDKRMIYHLWKDGNAPGPGDVSVEISKSLVTLTCEVCGREYLDSYDPKVKDSGNAIAVTYYCCSLKCERESWSDDFVPIGGE